MTSTSERKKSHLLTIVVIFAILSLVIASTNSFYLQGVNGANTTTITNTNSENTTSSLLLPLTSQELDTIMAEISNSDKPEDIATLAYIWGYPLVSMERSFNWFTNPQAPVGPSHGPANTINCNRELLTSNDTDVVLPNADTLYCVAWLDLSNGPLVLKVPAIKDRYYTFEFLDAYTNVYSYVGTRATGSSGGTYLIAGPDWKGEVPDGMTKIWSPTNLAWILQRTLVKSHVNKHMSSLCKLFLVRLSR